MILNISESYDLDTIDPNHLAHLICDKIFPNGVLNGFDPNYPNDGVTCAKLSDTAMDQWLNEQFPNDPDTRNEIDDYGGLTGYVVFINSWDQPIRVYQHVDGDVMTHLVIGTTKDAVELLNTDSKKHNNWCRPI